jgi:hypothetical protein
MNNAQNDDKIKFNYPFINLTKAVKNGVNQKRKRIAFPLEAVAELPVDRKANSFLSFFGFAGSSVYLQWTLCRQNHSGDQQNRERIERVAV